MKSLRSKLEDIQKENEHNTEYVESIEKQYRKKYNIYYNIFLYIWLCTITTAFFLYSIVEVIILIVVLVISARLYILFIKKQISKDMDNDKAYYLGMHLMPKTRSLNSVLNEYIRDNPDDYEQGLIDRIENDEPVVEVLNKMLNKIQSENRHDR